MYCRFEFPWTWGGTDDAYLMDKCADQYCPHSIRVKRYGSQNGRMQEVVILQPEQKSFSWIKDREKEFSRVKDLVMDQWASTFSTTKSGPLLPQYGRLFGCDFNSLRFAKILLDDFKTLSQQASKFSMKSGTGRDQGGCSLLPKCFLVSWSRLQPTHDMMNGMHPVVLHRCRYFRHTS